MLLLRAATISLVLRDGQPASGWCTRTSTTRSVLVHCRIGRRVAADTTITMMTIVGTTSTSIVLL
jgi:hypothetical protein